MFQVNSDRLPSHSVFNRDKFTCLSCHISFPGQDMQRIHMKTEWHRYNLKRRVANLQPIPAELFEEKVSTTKKETVEVDDFGFIINGTGLSKMKGISHLKVKKVNPRLSALNTHKHYNHHHNHLIDRDLSPARSEMSQFSIGSTLSVTSGSDIGNDEEIHSNSESEDSINHYLSSNQNTDIEIDDFTDEEEEPIIDFELDQCFYCNELNDSIESNIDHMFKFHGLYIPNKEKLIHRDDLLRVVADSIGIDRICLKCGYQSNKLIGIRQHIKSKGHANIPYESYEEREIWSPFYETDDKTQYGDDGEEEDMNVTTSGTELSLANGSKLGHRSMNRYYRQTIHRPQALNIEGENVNEEENSIAILDKKAQDVLHLRRVIIEKSEAKRIAKFDLMDRSKELSFKGLKYRNKILNYRNQRFG